MAERTLAYVQVTNELRQLALEQPLDSSSPFPAEAQLAQRFKVSRGTLRRATEELVREGLLSSEPGRGTYVRKRAQVRALVCDVLARLAVPDSRWHLDVRHFVPDFAGSAICHDLLAERSEYRDARTVFLAPDNSLRALVRRALDDGKVVLVPTYGMRRGIVRLDPALVPRQDREFASTLDGLERHGSPLTTEQLAAVGGVDLLVTGAIAFSTSGVHIGTGRAYLDIEWGILAELRLVDAQTPIIGVVHDAQVLDAELVPDPLDINVDMVITPSGIRSTPGGFERPGGLEWDELDVRFISETAYLAELRTQAHVSHEERA